MSDRSRLQEIHTEIETLKRRRKELNDRFKDELAQTPRHLELKEEMDTLKAERKSIENGIRERSGGEAAELDQIKMEIKSSEELMSDLAFNLIMKEESVELVDANLNRYVPVMLVKFKKDGYADKKEET